MRSEGDWMFLNDTQDPYERLQRLEWESLQHVNNIQELTKQLQRQAELIKGMTEQMKYMANSIIFLQQAVLQQKTAQ